MVLFAFGWRVLTSPLAPSQTVCPLVQVYCMFERGPGGENLKSTKTEWNLVYLPCKFYLYP